MIPPVHRQHFQLMSSFVDSDVKIGINKAATTCNPKYSGTHPHFLVTEAIQKCTLTRTVTNCQLSFFKLSNYFLNFVFLMKEHSPSCNLFTNHMKAEKSEMIHVSIASLFVDSHSFSCNLEKVQVANFLMNLLIIDPNHRQRLVNNKIQYSRIRWQQKI